MFQKLEHLCINNFYTNKKTMFFNSSTVKTGISDHHNLICTMLRSTFCKGSAKFIYYRSYNNYNKGEFKNVLKQRLVHSWKYNIRRNVNSDFSIVSMRRVPIIFFELEIVKNFMRTFLSQDTSWLFFSLNNCAWLQQFQMEIESFKWWTFMKNIVKKPTCKWACVTTFKQL